MFLDAKLVAEARRFIAPGTLLSRKRNLFRPLSPIGSPSDSPML